MLTANDILADMHTHTIASLHAYSTMQENLAAAAKQGLLTIAITDHYWGDGTELTKKNEVARIQYMWRCAVTNETPVAFVPSAEFNLGKQVVYKPERLRDLKWRLVGLHTWFHDVDDMTYDEFVRLFADAAEQGYNAFAHIEREMHRLYHGAAINDLDGCERALKDVVDIAVKRGITLELNECSLSRNEGHERDRAELWLKYACSQGARISLGSDAHFAGEVGRFSETIGLLNKVNYPKELILNCDAKRLYEMSCLSQAQDESFFAKASVR